MTDAVFDSWTDQYDNWFKTPIGRLIKTYELQLLLELLAPEPGEKILDVGCGTGIFTRDVLKSKVEITGIDLSFQMLKCAGIRLKNHFYSICADMTQLPFETGFFDRVFSMTAVEFVPELELAVNELNRVTRKGGTVVLTTLNSLSPWAERRLKKAEKGHPLFKDIYFRSPDDLRACLPENTTIKTAIHFQKDESLDIARQLEQEGEQKGSEKGAFLAAKYIKK